MNLYLLGFESGKCLLEIRFADNEELCERLKLRLRENLSNSFGVEAERWQFYNFKKIITCLFSFLIFTVDPCFVSNPFIPKAIYQSNLPGLHSLKSFCSIDSISFLVIPKYEKSLASQDPIFLRNTCIDS